MSDWKNDPATEKQKKRLRDEGIPFRHGLTKGEASDLIGETEPAGAGDLEILRFFKVQKAFKFSQTEARKQVAALLSDPENRVKWENRPANKEQRDIYKFFSIPIPNRLKYKDAENCISSLFEDENKYDEWSAYDAAVDDRKDAIDDAYDFIDMDRELFDCSRIGKRQFKEVVESLEADGMNVDDMVEFENEERIFKKIFELYPHLHKVNQNVDNRTVAKRRKNDSQGGVWLVVFFIVLVFILIRIFG